MWKIMLRSLIKIRFFFRSRKNQEITRLARVRLWHSVIQSQFILPRVQGLIPANKVASRPLWRGVRWRVACYVPRHTRKRGGKRIKAISVAPRTRWRPANREEGTEQGSQRVKPKRVAEVGVGKLTRVNGAAVACPASPIGRGLRGSKPTIAPSPKCTYRETRRNFPFSFERKCKVRVNHIFITIL